MELLAEGCMAPPAGPRAVAYLGLKWDPCVTDSQARASAQAFPEGVGAFAFLGLANAVPSLHLFAPSLATGSCRTPAF